MGGGLSQALTHGAGGGRNPTNINKQSAGEEHCHRGAGVAGSIVGRLVAAEVGAVRGTLIWKNIVYKKKMALMGKGCI